VHQFFEAQARQRPEAVAAVFEAEQLTYRELDQRANQLAHHLRKLQVGPEVLVGICMDVSLEMLVSLLAVLKAGGAYVPLDPTYPRERLGFMIRDARLPVLLTQQRLSTLLPEAIAQASAAQPGEARSPEPVLGATVVCVDTEWGAIEKESAETLASGVTPENLAYVIYTSGSTGKPKGVMVTHRNVANFFVGMDARLGAEAPGVWLAVTSISFDISVLELFWTLARGFKVVLQRKEERFSRTVPARTESSRRAMDFSLFYFASDQGAVGEQKYKLLLEGAQFADAHDFAAVWTPERHFHAFGGLYPNPSVTSAAVAVLTRRVQIRAGSVVLPLHQPLRVAEEWAVVDNLSHGRVGISFASGWQVNDFVLAPEQYARRKEVTLRQIDLVRRLWRGEAVGFPGANGQEVTVSILPRPIQRELPFWLTASGHPDTFKLAGQLGANLLTHLLGQTTAELAENLAAYHAAWTQSGHPGRGHVTLMLHTFVGEDLHTVRETVRGPFTAYLRSSIDLIKNTPWVFPTFKPPMAALANSGAASNGFTEEEIEFMARHAFDRYFETSGFFGTPQTCLARVEQLRELGVDEIACLLDFGVETDTVLASLDLLNEVRIQSRPQTARPRPDYSLAAQVARHGVTHLQCTPSLAAMLAEEAPALAALRSLKMLLLGGEALPADLVQRLDLPGRLLNMYGPTETTIWSTTQAVDKGQRSVPIGRPIANTEVCLVDESLHPVPAGTPGELLIGGAGVARGYLHRPELTAEKFIPHPLQPGTGARLYRTGDLARSAPDGTLEFLGRIDQQVKLRGFRVELGEIETALRQHPAVKDCAVAVSEIVPGDKRLFAYFVAAPGPLPALAELREFLEAKLPDFMVPAAFIPLPALPLTPNGKLDRKALPAPQSVGGQGGRSGVAPATPVEQQVAAVWREVLGVEQVGLSDNFFELGGNSILATQLVSRLRRLFPGELPLELAFEFPTLQALAAHLESAQQPAVAPQQSIGRRANVTEWPLSFAQRRMWFLDQLEPGPHYNEHFHLRLSGPLNPLGLQNALNEIVRRHESLRATFSRLEGRPVQRPVPQLTLPLPLTDLSAFPERERQAQAAELAVADTRKLFDLESGPLLRASLLRLGPEEHILALTFHHIIVDGWSRGVFLRELSALYKAFLAGRPSPLPELTIQYADFAAWQQDWLRGAVMDQHLAYWKQQLGSALALLDLPTDRPRPPVQTYRGARLPVELDKATVDALSALGRQHGCTLYMVLLAAFQALLARYTGSEDIVVGSPVAQRNRPELEGLVGYFLNSLVLRTDLSREPSFTALLARVRKVALEAYAHQDFPFEKLVAELQPERALGFSPVFQVMFILQTAAIPPEPVAGLRFSAFEIDSGVSKVDLTLSLEETPQGCSGWVEYATDLFDRATVERLCSHFRTLLAAALAQPALPLSQLPLPGVPTRRPAPPDLLSLDSRPRPGDAGRLSLEVPGRTSAPSLDAHAPPRSPVEKELARIWAEVLQVEKVGLHDTMFDLGGHSLLITMITARIRTAFQTDISIRAFFETPTLEAIAALIETNLDRRGLRSPQAAAMAAPG
jgi:natural product biosynthesis luciferase-like monooxygenase protein